MLTLPDVSLIRHEAHVPERHALSMSTPASSATSRIVKSSDTRRPVPEDLTILDVADEAGVLIDNACRSGTCASCRIKLTSGRVSMAVQDALTEQDKADGYILACQAKVHGDVSVDA